MPPADNQRRSARVMEWQKERGVVTLRLTAEDLSHPHETVSALEDLLSEGERRFVADLGALSCVTSLQAGTLFSLHALCYENLAILKLAGAVKKVNVILRLIGLDKIMEFHHGREVALASFGPYDGDPPLTPGTPLKGMEPAPDNMGKRAGPKATGG